MTRTATGYARGKNPASHGHVPTAQKHHRWKPGGSVASNGYVKIRVGKGHPLADPNGYAYEHTVIWCAAGEPRPPMGWLIDHRNEDKTDNRFDNLELKRRGSHNAEHLSSDRRRCPKTGRLLPKQAGRSWDETPR